MEISIVKLTCQSLENPLGVVDASPAFGWAVVSNGRAVLQTGYQVIVVRSGETRPTWDSGWVASAQSQSIRYQGPELSSRGRYQWKVRIDAELQETPAGPRRASSSPWSPWASFEMAMDPAEWRGQFLSAEGPDSWLESRGTRLRKAFRLSKGVAAVRVFATALGLYELSLNGTPVGEAVLAPGWTSYHKRLPYQVYDVTPLVRGGENVLGASVGAGWYKGDLAGWLGRRNVYGGQAALLAQVVVTYDDGSEEIIATDASWRCANGPILSSEIYHGEVYDARFEDSGWDGPGFDDSSWRSPTPIAHDASVLVPSDGVPVTRHEHFQARLLETPKGERVLDFGQNLAGRVRFSVRGPAGARVSLRHAEILDAEGNFYTANLRRAKARILYVLSGNGEETYEPHFTYMGFRYVCVDEWPGDLDPAAFEAVAISSAMHGTGEFSCSNELVNRLHHNILWGLKGNFVDVPTDCPQRDERLGWTGDAQVFIATASFLADTRLFFRKWLRDLAVDTGPEGRVPFVVPQVLVPRQSSIAAESVVDSSCGWGDAATICPWTLYLAYGDVVLLKEQYPTMRAWVENIRRRATGGLLWDTGFHFGDWVALDAQEGSYFGATPNAFTATAFYARSTELLAKAARVLGEADDAQTYSSLHQRIVRAFRDEYFSPAGTIAVRTQTACILSLEFDLVAPEHRRRVRDTLLALIDENGGHLVTGFLGTPYFCSALTKAGAVDAAYTLLMREDYPSWLYQVHRGATTVWEHWDGLKPDGSMWSPDMNSFNHYAYGSIGQWLHETVAGLAPDESAPGYQTILFRPQPGGGLAWARASLATPYGRAAIAWHVGEEGLSVDLEVPPNARGRFFAPGSTNSVEIGSGRWHLVCSPDGNGSAPLPLEPTAARREHGRL